MATQHARPATKNSTDATGEGGELKNGTADDSSDDSSANNMVNKGRSTTPGPNSNNVDAFQDGGQPTANSRPPNMEYPYHQQNFNNQEDFNNSEYRGNYEHEQNSKLYPQYGNQMRPPFSPRAQPRYPARFVSGPSVSQQTGPTPTLNQLLQAPNSMQRYHNNYEYPNQQKGDQQHYPNNQWGRGYPQQMYRNQGDVKQQRSYQMSSPGSQPYPQQPPYPPYPQGPRHNYPQQQQQGGQQHPSGTPQQQQHGPSGYDGQRPQMANYSPANVPPPTPTPPSQQQPQQPPPQQQQPDGCDEGEGVPPTTAAPLRTTPPGVSPHRPPSGSPSPSMSPALGQPMPPRPSSTQSDNSGQGPSATPQGYTPQPMAPPGMYGVNKMHQNMMPPSSHYPPQTGGYHRPPGSMASMHNYGGQNSSYPPSGPPYPPGGGQQRMPSTTSGGYPPSNTGAPYNQPPYPASGGGASYGGMPPPNHYPKASMPPPPAAAAGAQAAAQAAVIAAAASSGGTVRQSPMYLRQHLQQKMYNSYGPDMPPPPNTSEGAASTIGPPTATTSSPSAVTASSPSEMMQSPRNSMGPPPLMDEGSQASNASASSSLPEDNNRVETPKPAMSKQQPMMSHPLPSPGAASMSSFHDDLESVSSPSWPRTPASPVINNQPYDHHPIKRPDGLLKLYDMSDDLERRLFLDKLIVYQEERGTPLSQCPTISKQPLDLYRLYMAAKERGGFVEVMKGKMWKEIAGLVGIGASSGAAYTLRKQYIKHLLPFECKFDRGGIDPVPLISSLESSSRKKAKNQGGPMMDGYPGPYPGGGGGGGYPHPGLDYPGGHHPPYPTDSGPPMPPHPNHSSEGAMDPFSDDIQQPYPPQSQRHNSSSEGGGYAYPPTAGPPYGGGATSTSFGGGYGGGQEPPYSGEQYPPDAGYGGRDPYAPPPGGYPPNRTVGPASQYPPYQNPCGDQERFAEPQPANPSPMLRPSTPTSSVIGPPPQQESSLFPRYPSQPMGAREPQPMGAYQGGRPTIGPTPSPSQYSSNSQTSSSPGQYTQTDAYNRGGVEFQPQMSRLQSTLIQRLLPKNQSSQQNYPPSQPPPQQGQGGYGGVMPPPNKVAPPGNIPPAMYQRGDMYQKRHPEYPPKDPYHYPLQTPSQAPYTDRNQYQYRPSHGMPPQSAGPPPPPQQGWPRDGRSYGGQYPQQRDNWGENPSHPPWAPRYGGPPQPEPPYMGGPKMMSRGFPHNKMAPHGGGSATTAPPQYTTSTQQNQRHREVHFPPDCVESTLPLLLGKRRRRIVSRDLPPIDPWRLMMSLKSGLLGEGTWALDVLNILLHDDATVLYFGLAHMPGLLEVVVEHYRRCLWLVFGMKREAEVGYCEEATTEDKTTSSDNTTEDKWWELDSDRRLKNDAIAEPVALSQNGDRTQLLLDTTNYTHRTRCRKMVKTEEESEVPLFLLERKWDLFEGHASDGGHWARGGGEFTGHIQTHFEDDERRVRFCRVLEDVNRSTSKSTSNDNGSKVEDSVPNDGKGSIPKTSSPDDKDSKEQCGEKNSSVESVNSDPKVVVENGERTCETDSTMEGDFPKMRESCKRRAEEDLEEESYTRDEPSLCTVTDAQDSLSRRCIAVSSILRNLSFVPGNDAEMSKHSGFLLVLGRLLLLHHKHSPRKPPQRHYDQREDEVVGEPASTAAIASDSCSSLNGEGEWWWETLHIVRENTLVTLANVCGQLDLAPFPEEISFPLLDGLMHWVTCPSSSARDPLPTLPPHSVLSPQRLSLEALSKLSVLESNVDLMMALPPWERTSRLLSLLARWLARNEDQVLREFSVVLLSNLAQADSAVARAIALQPPCVPLLITFVEQAEQSALAVANAQGIGALRDNPELMGTTLDMVRRAAGTLRCLARVPANRCLFLRHQQRLLALVMSQILDQGVASIVADVLFECSSGDTEESSSH